MIAPDDVFHRVLLAIARGAHRHGDTLPSPEEAAREWTVSPVRVREAYARLVREGLGESYEEHGVMVLGEGRERARRLLLARFSRVVAEEAELLIAAGCDAGVVREAALEGAWSRS